MDDFIKYETFIGDLPVVKNKGSLNKLTSPEIDYTIKYVNTVSDLPFHDNIHGNTNPLSYERYMTYEEYINKTLNNMRNIDDIHTVCDKHVEHINQVNIPYAPSYVKHGIIPYDSLPAGKKKVIELKTINSIPVNTVTTSGSYNTNKIYNRQIDKTTVKDFYYKKNYDKEYYNYILNNHDRFNTISDNIDRTLNSKYNIKQYQNIIYAPKSQNTIDIDKTNIMSYDAPISSIKQESGYTDKELLKQTIREINNTYFRPSTITEIAGNIDLQKNSSNLRDINNIYFPPFVANEISERIKTYFTQNAEEIENKYVPIKESNIKHANYDKLEIEHRLQDELSAPGRI